MAWGEPEVGNLWCSEFALAKAVASTGLRGIRISEGELLPRLALNGILDTGPTGSELVLSLIRALRASDESVATVRHRNEAGPC